MPHLTPGDFAAVQRQHRFQPVRDAEMLGAALIQTCRLKNDETSDRIGSDRIGSDFLTYYGNNEFQKFFCDCGQSSDKNRKQWIWFP
jgi:hypothetical protein